MKSKNMKKTVGILCGVLLLCGAGYLYWCHSLEDQVIWDKVSVNGVLITGKTKEQASQLIQERFEQDFKDAGYVVSLGDSQFEIPVYSALSLDAEEEIRKAYELGHGKWYTRVPDFFELSDREVQSVTVFPDLTSPENISNNIKESGIGTVNTVQETQCSLTPDSLVIKKGKTGVTADVKALEKKLLDRLEQKEYNGNISCPQIKVFPKDIDLKPYYDKIYVKTVNAAYDKENGFQILPSTSGISFDLKKAETDLEKAKEGSTITITFVKEEPEIQETDLEEKLYRDVLGSYTTYGGGSAGRRNNIILACSSCNDKILMPGEIFSYNEAVGQRTAARGYQSATVFADGKAVPGIGGGICQVSTTMYAACRKAGLEIVERHPHSLPVAYVPAGMDATVSWGTLDYKFKNSTEYPIRIQATYENDSINVQIVGTIE